MSRTLSAEAITAITENDTYRMTVRADIDPSRSYFSALTDDNPWDGGDYSTVTDTPVGQAACYSTIRGNMVTFIVHPSTGVIYAMDQGSASQNSLGITADEETKPGVWHNDNGTVTLWYWSSGNALTRVTVNMSTFGVSGSANIEPVPPSWTITKGSPTPISTAGDCMFVYQTSIGGLGVAYFDGAGSWERWDGRFLSPNTLIDNGYWTIYSTGARAVVDSEGRVYAYQTDITTGEVRGVYFNQSTGSWSDTFTALPADLSRFCITNAFSANGYIHMAGQFHRTEDLEDAKVYTLLLRSKDGKVFSWDRFTLISKLGYQFHVAINGDIMYASDRNSVGTAALSHFLAIVPGTRASLSPPSDIIEYNTSAPGSASLTIKAYDEAYIDHTVIRKGSLCKVYLGYSTSVGDQDFHYMDYIIANVSTSFADGVRGLVLDLVAEGLWKTGQIAFPFYSEIISKSTLLDDCDELDHMYPATGGTLVGTYLPLDLWHHEEWDGGALITTTPYRFDTGKGAGVEYKSPSGAIDYGIQTPELDDYDFIKELPIITGTSLTIGSYGWAMTLASARPNPTITLYIITVDDDDVETERTGSLTSTYAVWPKEYINNVAGSYPIEYQFTGLTAGHRLKHVCMRIQNADTTSEGYIYPERLDVTGVSFLYGNINTNKTWKQTKPDSYAETDPTILEVPGIGVPYVQFLTKPYTAYNYEVNASFEYLPGDEPAAIGTIGWGVIGMGKNGTNFILARYNVILSQIELVKVREGIETLLDTWNAIPFGIVYDVMMEHRDGRIQVTYKDSQTWVEPVITYHWDEVTEGVISTSETGIMHVGIYGAIKTPGFRHTSLNIYDSDGIGMIAGQSLSILDVQNFPGSGKVVLDGLIFSYNSKTPNSLAYGPVQGRQTSWYVENLDQMGQEIALYHPDWADNAVAGYLVASENGHTWLIDSSWWEVEHSTGGQPDPLRHRSRHYGDQVNGNHIGTAHRVYIAPGLTSFKQVDSNTALMHPHGNWCFRWGSEKIWVKEAAGTTIDHDATVKDMTKYLCGVASVDAEYPGDWTNASIGVSGSPVELASTERLFPGGYDVQFNIPSLGGGGWIAIYGSNQFVGDPDDTENVDIGIKDVGGSLTVYSYPQDDVTDPVYVESGIPSGTGHRTRILFHDIYCSVYIDDQWVYTFTYRKYDKDADDFTNMIKWPDEMVNLYIYADGSRTVTNVLVTELFDWREAIYIESEMSASSALGSVIQERPIEIFPTVLGGLSFSYNIERDEITYTDAISTRIVHAHDRINTTSPDAGSDAIVYFRDVDFATDLNFADEEGFLTRVFKLSGLETGAKNAALLLLEKANERQYIHNLDVRPDIRLEQGDRIIFTYTLTGTGTVIAYEVIIESISMRIMEGGSDMTVTAREDITA